MTRASRTLPSSQSPDDPGRRIWMHQNKNDHYCPWEAAAIRCTMYSQGMTEEDASLQGDWGALSVIILQEMTSMSADDMEGAHDQMARGEFPCLLTDAEVENLPVLKQDMPEDQDQAIDNLVARFKQAEETLRNTYSSIATIRSEIAKLRGGK